LRAPRSSRLHGRHAGVGLTGDDGDAEPVAQEEDDGEVPQFEHKCEDAACIKAAGVVIIAGADADVSRATRTPPS
jgi:hypothetical protein